MDIIKQASKSFLDKFRRSSIAFVPTMGYLHHGHVSLVQLAKRCADIVVMSIYVNPTQFNSIEDLEKYPRNLQRDYDIASAAGVDVLYVPSDSDMYSSTSGGVDGSRYSGVYVKAGVLSECLCGLFRPGHFDGVLLIVAKLFNIIKPDIAIFGEKDYQQLQIIRKMVCDLCFPIEIVSAPLVRDEDGLALSSRNARLSIDERLEALKLSKSLFEAKAMFDKGERASSVLLDRVRSLLSDIKDGRVEYAEIVDASTLEKEEVVQPNKPVRLMLAVCVSGVRLIDNIELVSLNH